MLNYDCINSHICAYYWSNSYTYLKAYFGVNIIKKNPNLLPATNIEKKKIRHNDK